MLPEVVTRFVRRVWAMAFKEALHIRRDPITLMLAIGMPVVLIILFGFGVSFDTDHIPLAVLDQDHSPVSRQVTRWYTEIDDFELKAQPETLAAGEELLRRGQAAGVLIIPEGFARKVARGEKAEMQLLVDGSDGNSTNQVLNKADAISRVVAQRLAGVTFVSPLDVRVMTRFNPTGQSALFLVPGIIAYVLAIVAVLVTALAVAREWERGSMEQLFATPVGRLEIVVGKLLPYLGLGAVQTTMVLCIGAWVFDLPLRGLPLVALSALIFILGMLGQGLLISVVTRNQMVATQAGAFSSLLPSMLLSGFLFPVDNMPPILRTLSFVVPARWFVALLRGVLLKGTGIDTEWPHLAALVVFAVAMIAASTARFHRRLA